MGLGGGGGGVKKRGGGYNWKFTVLQLKRPTVVICLRNK